MPKFSFPYPVETFAAIPPTDPTIYAKVHQIFRQLLNIRNNSFKTDSMNEMDDRTETTV